MNTPSSQPLHAECKGNDLPLLGHVSNQVSDVMSLDNCAILNAFEESDNGHYTAKSPVKSHVMRGHLRHLPIVPGVVQKGLLIKHLNISEDVYSGKAGIKTEFGAPILPGIKVIFNKEDNAIVHENGDLAVQIDHAPNYGKKFDVIFSESKQRDFTDEELDAMLLQSDDFRFASGMTMLSSSEEICSGNVFQGHYNIPKDFRFFDIDESGEKIVSPYIIEEMAAQIGVLAMGKITGKVTNEARELIENSSTLTFRSSICRYTGNTIKPGQQFRLTGQVKDIQKREASFAYLGFDENGREIIAGEISGNIVMLKILKRLFK